MKEPLILFYHENDNQICNQAEDEKDYRIVANGVLFPLFSGQGVIAEPLKRRRIFLMDSRVNGAILFHQLFSDRRILQKS